MNSMIRAVMEATDLPTLDSEHPVWGVGDCQSAESATRCTLRTRKPTV